MKVAVGHGAKAVFVERVEGGGSPAPSSLVSHLAIGDGAEVLWVVDQAKDFDAAHLGQLNVAVGANATFKLFVLNAGGALVRQEVHAVTAGEGSQIIMRGVNLLRKDQHVDVTTTLRHTHPNTTATETFRNTAAGSNVGLIAMVERARMSVSRTGPCRLLASGVSSIRRPTWTRRPSPK